jgi:DNA topoisomerase VI subunit B
MTVALYTDQPVVSIRPKLAREVFATSRLLEFCSTKELINQTGHGVAEWPLVILKELVDNAIDACEEAEVAPSVTVAVGNGHIVVTDNGPGIEADVVKKILDYNVRVSSREAYVSPTRGAQGNALKTILAMPFALNGTMGETIIEAKGIAHRVTFAVDHIRQQPKIEHAESASEVKIGTRITVPWPVSACSNPVDVRQRFLLIAEGFAWINPHLTLEIDWHGERTRMEASAAAWEKWRPSYPTSPHWYDTERLARLMGAYIASDRDGGREPRTVWEFISEFKGLTGTAKRKAVLDAVGAARVPLPAFFGIPDRDLPRIAGLLEAMRNHSRPVKPLDLGVIGEDHLRHRLLAAGADEETFRYSRQVVEGELPAVVECAFGYCEGNERQIVTGVNWSPGIGNPFRTLGHYGQSLDTLLIEQRAGRDEPITLVIHMTCPRVDYTDRGKSALVLAGRAADAIITGLRAVTKEWARQRKAEERDVSRRERRRASLVRSRKRSIKDVAYSVMRTAYLRASANDTLPAKARQVMYAARPLIQQETGKPLDDQYFTQTLLPDYMQEYGVSWNVVFDDRGHFHEPHTGRTVGLGTLAVDSYLKQIGEPKFEAPGFASAKVRTRGPACRFGAVLFIEKEGFLPLLEHAQLAERYDLAIMSTKGLSNTAARRLADEMCSRHHLPLFILHDFDKAGFSIVGTLKQSNRRYEFQNKIDVIDFGLRLADVEGRETEIAVDKGSASARRANLRKNGATPEEAEFLLRRRVELNAFTSDELISFIERKLNEHGVAKVVPTEERLAEAYRLFVRSARVEKIVEAVLRDAEDTAINVPSDLSEKVRSYLEAHPEEPWDRAVETLTDEIDGGV